MFQEFPKWKYSADGAVIVDDADAEAALVGEWFDFPDAVATAEDDKAARINALIVEENTELETLRATAADLGIVVDGRWKAQRIETEIKAKIQANGKAAVAPPVTATDPVAGV